MYRALEVWHRGTALSLAEKEVTTRRQEECVRAAWQTWSFRKCVIRILKAAQLY